MTLSALAIAFAAPAIGYWRWLTTPAALAAFATVYVGFPQPFGAYFVAPALPGLWLGAKYRRNRPTAGIVAVVLGTGSIWYSVAIGASTPALATGIAGFLAGVFALVRGHFFFGIVATNLSLLGSVWWLWAGLDRVLGWFGLALPS
ncbi:MAG: hypothetical protein FJX65_08565 [Alphaproteobacteria bacterium]|nr:hypothetical protein [Alphaproteobacteria bacterium]